MALLLVIALVLVAAAVTFVVLVIREQRREAREAAWLVNFNEGMTILRDQAARGIPPLRDSRR